MINRIYYYLLLWVSIPLFLYTLLFAYLHSTKGINLYDPGLVLNLFVIYILYKESRKAGKKVLILNFFFVTVPMQAGIVFKLQHWPSEYLILIGSLGPALTVFGYYLYRAKANRMLTICILLFPLVHVISMNLRLSHQKGQAEFFMLELLSLMLLSAFTTFQVIRKA